MNIGKPSDERGVALLTALLVVLVLSAVAVAALETLQRGQRLAANASSLAQAQWYALGADSFVSLIAEDLYDNPLAGVALAEGEIVQTLPLDNGYMELHIADGSTCINLNAVVAGANNTYQRHETGAAQFEALLIALEYTDVQARELTGSLIAWIDSTDSRGATGRDDSPYLSRTPSYMTGREPLAEVSELRAVRGFTPEIYDALRPFVCAHPNVGPSKINLNALTEDDAPILVALFEGRINDTAARRIIANRPETGWSDLGQFWSGRDVAAVGAPEAAIEQAELTPRYLDLTVNVTHLDAQTTMSSLLVFNGGTFRTAARRWSEDA